MSNKSKDDLKRELSAESYYVTQESGTERPFTVNIGIIMKMGLISAFAAVKYYFNQKQNLMQAVAGQAFSKLVKVKKLMS